MKNPFIRLFRARDKPGATDSVSSAPTFYFGSSAAGKSVTASTAIQMSTVYACARVIAETIARLYRRRGRSADGPHGFVSSARSESRGCRSEGTALAGALSFSKAGKHCRTACGCTV